jgi:hypothetical protein
VHHPVLDELQVSELQPAGIRATIRWDKNPWALTTGNPHVEREPVFWLCLIDGTISGDDKIIEKHQPGRLPFE